MNKILKYISKHENIFVFLLILIPVIGVTLWISLIASDELWNFQNVYKIYNGYGIYDGANVICTPLFFLIGNFMFQLFGANFFVFRIYSVIIFTVLYFMTYKTLRELKVSKTISALFIIIEMLIGEYGATRIMANYNSMVIMFATIGIYHIIKNKNNFNAKNIAVQSIICFLIAITKQNVGIFYALGLFWAILLVKNKNKIKGVLEEIGILLLLSITFLLILNATGILEGFINYAILGIDQFANFNKFSNLLCIVIICVMTIIGICVSYVLIKNPQKPVNEEEKNNLITMNCFAIPLYFIIFPIMNEAHFLLAIHIGLILTMYIINIIIKGTEINIYKHKILETVLIIFVIGTISIGSYTLFLWTKYISDENYKYNYNEPYFGAIVSKNLERNIKEIIRFIENEEKKGKNTIIYSSKAALYMVPLKKSNGYIDMPLYGNFGSDTEEDIIRKIENMENTNILLEKNEENLEWQESKKIVRTLKNDLQKIGEIEEFEIYTKK